MQSTPEDLIARAILSLRSSPPQLADKWVHGRKRYQFSFSLSDLALASITLAILQSPLFNFVSTIRLDRTWRSLRLWGRCFITSGSSPMLGKHPQRGAPLRRRRPSSLA